MKTMKEMKAMARKAAHKASCLWLDIKWLCWGAWLCSAEEMLDQAGLDMHGDDHDGDGEGMA